MGRPVEKAKPTQKQRKQKMERKRRNQAKGSKKRKPQRRQKKNNDENQWNGKKRNPSRFPLPQPARHPTAGFVLPRNCNRFALCR